MPRKAKRSRLHVYNGFPHKSSKKPHHCMCLDNCCQSEEDGCICRSCPCQDGKPHGREYPQDVPEIHYEAHEVNFDIPSEEQGILL
jgi:hypothetical protein